MKTIQLTDEQYSALMQGEPITIEPPKPEKWQPKYGEWYVSISGRVLKGRPFGTFPSFFGMEYQTEEQAVKARDAMRKHNRLLAWLSENDDGWVADWNDDRQGKYYIYSVSTSRGKKYGFASDWDYKDLTRIYMSENNARKLVELLNDGTVEL